ncbi:MAG: Na+/H+ antiporter subunit E [Pseudomonadota bacterium]
MLHSPVRFVILSLLLYAVWLLLSGVYIPRLLIKGALICVVVAYVVDRVRLLDNEGLPLELLPRAVLYWSWLAIEIVKSALNVTRIIISPSLPISPTVIVFRPSQKTDVGLATHGNSITLTPGTITTGISKSRNTIEVHAIERNGAAGCVDSVMDRQVSNFERALVGKGE